MIKNKIKFLFIVFATSLLFIQCKDDDDNNNTIEQETCTDGIQNGDEEGVDCGGTKCIACDDGSIDFSGTFIQEDVLGRPAINILFGGSSASKNEYNETAVSNRSDFQTLFINVLEEYYDSYAFALDIPLDELNYEANILDWNAETFTTIMANYDALQVAPDGPTTYYDPDSELLFTGRSLADDVIDINLILMFGGENGTRFDGNNDTPQLTSDGVDLGDRDFSLPFPYLESPVVE